MTRTYRQTTAAAGPAAGPRRLAAVLLALLIVLPGLAAAAPDWRRSAQEQLEPNNLVRPNCISLEQAANKVRRQTGGRVLSASPDGRQGRCGYEVRVLEEGKRVKSYVVDGDGHVRSRD